MDTVSSAAPIFLFSHRGALGDFALTWPLLRRLRALYPRHRFVGLGRPGHLELALALGLLDAGLDAESAALLPFYEGRSLPEALTGADKALLWMHGESAAGALSGLLSALPGPVCVHLPFPGLEDDVHVVEHHLAALEKFTKTGADEDFPPQDSRRPFSFPNIAVRKDPGLILLHPGSGSKAKNFSREFYLRLAEALPAWHGGGHVEIVLGPAEHDEAVFYRGRLPVVSPSTPLDLARRLASAALYVGNDSGPAHVSALLGTPTFALYKNTDPRVWGVRGRAAVSILAANEAQAEAELRKALSSLRENIR